MWHSQVYIRTPKVKRFTPPSVTWYSATTLYAELKWQKFPFQCIHIKRSPSYSTFTFGVVWTWAVVVCSSIFSPWMLHHSFPFTCCFASEVTGLKPTGFRLKEYLVNDSVLRIIFWSNVRSFFPYFLHFMGFIWACCIYLIISAFYIHIWHVDNLLAHLHQWKSNLTAADICCNR